MASKITRISFACLLLVLLAAVLTTASSAWLVAHFAPASLERFLSWYPGDAQLRRRAASSHLLSLEDSELRAAAALYREALSRNPLDEHAWEGLADIESRLPADGGEEAVLRGWLAAIPHSPRAAWALANLLLRNGSPAKAFPYFRQAAADDASLRQPLFELSWKVLDDPQRILRDLIPDNEEALVGYFYFLAGDKGKLAEAVPVWRDIQRRDSPRTEQAGMFLVERLAGRGMGQTAQVIWNEIRPVLHQNSAGSAVHNGDFEQPLTNAGLDWRLTPGAGFQFSLDDFQAAQGSRSLRIVFDGTTNPEFAEIQQWVVVKPDTNYEFIGSIRTENLTTDNGLFFSLSSVSGDGTVSEESATDSQSGSQPWTQHRLSIHTSPETQVLLLRVRRRASQKLNSLLQGKAWLDAVSLQPR